MTPKGHRIVEMAPYSHTTTFQILPRDVRSTLLDRKWLDDRLRLHSSPPTDLRAEYSAVPPLLINPSRNKRHDLLR